MSTRIFITGLQQLQKRLQEAADANRRAHMEKEAREVQLQVFASTPTSPINEPVRPIRSLLKGAGPTAQREQEQQLRFSANGVLGWMSLEGNRTSDTTGIVHVVSGDGGSAVELPVYLEDNPYPANPYDPMIGKYLYSITWAGSWGEWIRDEGAFTTYRVRPFTVIQVVIPRYREAETHEILAVPVDTKSGAVAVRNGVRKLACYSLLTSTAPPPPVSPPPGTFPFYSYAVDRIYDEDAPFYAGLRTCGFIVWADAPFVTTAETVIDNNYYYPDRLVRFSHTTVQEVTDTVSSAFWTAYDSFRPHVRDAGTSYTMSLAYEIFNEFTPPAHEVPFTLDGIDFDVEIYDVNTAPVYVKEYKYEYANWDYFTSTAAAFEFYGTPGYLWLDEGSGPYAWFTGGASQQYAYSSVSAFANEFVLDALLGTFPFEYDDVSGGLSKVDYYALFDYFPAGYCLEALYKQAPDTEAGYVGPDTAFNSGLPSFTVERYADVDENYGEDAGWGSGINLFTMAYPTIITPPATKTFTFVAEEDRLPAAEIREKSHHILYTNVFNNEAQVISKLASLGVNLPPLS